MKRKKVAAMILASALACGCLTSCGPAGTTQTAGPQGTELEKTGLDLVYTLSSEPNYLDPAIATDNNTAAVVVQLYYGLFEYDEAGKVQNKGCESVEVSDDGLVYTLHLRQGNTWSDGQPVTAGDYVYGMKRSIAYGPDAYFIYMLYDYVKGADAAHENGLEPEDMNDIGLVAKDDSTIEITLNAPCAYFTGMLANPVAFPVRQDYAQTHTSDWANDPSVPTNGPFKLASVNAKEEIVMVKNEYFVDAENVTVDKLTARVISDSQSQLAAFETGEVDVATYVPSDVAATYAGREELVDLGPVVQNSFLWINCTGETNEALADVRVRQAMSLAIDREQLIVIAGAPEYKYPLYGYVPRGIAGKAGDFREEADAENPYTGYDLGKAKELMKDAGYGEGGKPLTIKYRYNSSAINTDIAVAIQSMWQQIGIETELVASEQKAYAADRKAGAYEVARGSTSADYIDPYYYLERWVSSNQAYKQVNDAHYDELITSANAELDPTNRMEGLHEAEKYLIQDMMYTIPLYGQSQITLARSGLTGFQHDPSDNLRYAYVTEQ